jgi:hypothetical protein
MGSIGESVGGKTNRRAVGPACKDSPKYGQKRMRNRNCSFRIRSI